MKLAVIIGAAILALCLALPVPALAVDLHTPGRPAYCDYVPMGDTVHPNVPNPRTDFYCWTPNDGFYVDMHATGHVFGHDYEEQLRGAYPRTDQVLGFGQRWSQPGFRCVSRRSGLTCRNDAKHGWWLGRFRGYRVF